MNNQTNTQLPFYLKISQIVMGLTALFYVMYIGQGIILPLIYALVLAILLNPLVNFLCRFKFNRVIAILVSVILAFLVFGAVIYFISAQATKFSETLPQLKEKFNLMFGDMIAWFSHKFNVSTTQVNNWITNTKGEGLKNSSAIIGQTIISIGSALAMIFLIPVYIFLFLFYKPLLLEFIAKLFPRYNHSTVAEVLVETKALIQNYLVGLMLETAIVAILNAAGLLILGIQYAILLGLIGALLNLIPYIGGIVAIAMPMIIALATKSPEYVLYVFLIYILVQFIDNNFLVPKIVASKVKINALVSIVVVLLGGALWGVPGMFLSIPLTAIVKVIFDRIEPLKAWGYLLGDTIPSFVHFRFQLPHKRTKKLAPSKK